MICSSVQNNLPSHVTYRNVKIKVYKTMFFPVIFSVSETQSLSVTEGRT
jgi:hypothetical protein